MKVAFASSDGLAIDRHFGLTDKFYLWDIAAESAHYLGVVSTDACDDDQEDKIVARACALEGCTLVYSMQIGGPAAAKLAARHIHPMKTAIELPVADAVCKLQQILQGRPPPWLSKAMGVERTESLQADNNEE